MNHAQDQNRGGIEKTYNISDRIAYWRQLHAETGNPLFLKQAQRLELERKANNSRLQKAALQSQPKLFNDAPDT